MFHSGFCSQLWILSKCIYYRYCSIDVIVYYFLWSFDIQGIKFLSSGSYIYSFIKETRNKFEIYFFILSLSCKLPREQTGVNQVV